MRPSCAKPVEMGRPLPTLETRLRVATMGLGNRVCMPLYLQIRTIRARTACAGTKTTAGRLAGTPSCGDFRHRPALVEIRARDMPAKVKLASRKCSPLCSRWTPSASTHQNSHSGRRPARRPTNRSVWLRERALARLSRPCPPLASCSGVGACSGGGGGAPRPAPRAHARAREIERGVDAPTHPPRR